MKRTKDVFERTKHKNKIRLKALKIRNKNISDEFMNKEQCPRHISIINYNINLPTIRRTQSSNSINSNILDTHSKHINKQKIIKKVKFKDEISDNNKSQQLVEDTLFNPGEPPNIKYRKYILNDKVNRSASLSKINIKYIGKYSKLSSIKKNLFKYNKKDNLPNIRQNKFKSNKTQLNCHNCFII